MTLLQSWKNSLTIFLPRRLFPLLGSTLQSLGTLYQLAWPYILGYAVAVSTLAIFRTPTEEPAMLSLPVILGIIASLAGAILQMLLITMLLPSSQGQPFAYYRARIKSHWLLLLLPFIAMLILAPVMTAVILWLILMASVYTKYSTSSTALALQQLPFSPEAHIHVAATIMAVAYTLGLYLYITMIFYLDGMPGYGKLMRAMADAFKLFWRNLPLVLILLVPQLVLVFASISHLLLTPAMFSPTLRAIYTATHALIVIPIVLSILVNLYTTLRPSLSS